LGIAVAELAPSTTGDGRPPVAWRGIATESGFLARCFGLLPDWANLRSTAAVFGIIQGMEFGSR
jgi:hypothetical protein